MQKENLNTEICAEGRQCKETQGGDGHLQAKERGLEQTLLSHLHKEPTCQHVDLELSASRAVDI